MTAPPLDDPVDMLFPTQQLEYENLPAYILHDSSASAFSWPTDTATSPACIGHGGALQDSAVELRTTACAVAFTLPIDES